MSSSAPKLLDLTFDGPVAFLRLDDGRGNALSGAMLQAIEKALKDAEEARVVVLSGREKIFGGGLDLPGLLSGDRAAIRDFVGLFNRVHLQLLSYPRPLITVARGSAVAGGAILLCAGDERLVAPNGAIGIPEVALGLPFPIAALELVRVALGERGVAEAALTGRMYEGEERKRVGFATEVLAPEALEPRARELAAERAKLDPVAVARVRMQLRRAGLERVKANVDADTEAFLDCWFSPRAQEELKAAVERLKAPRK